MTKKVAVINDLSGFGRCSLTAAISVIATMGVQPCPLPTAVLSGQTGYPSYFFDDYTEKMERFREEWVKMDVSFDGIYTGFMSGERQVEQVFRFLDTFYRGDTFLMVDPVLGDGGERFSMCTPAFLKHMKELVKRADIITPNLTELCILTDRDYRLFEEASGAEELLSLVEKTAAELRAWGPGQIVVTGVRYQDPEDGTERIGNLAVTGAETYLASFAYIGGSFSGTGDLFASAVAGGRARGDRLPDVMEKAGRMIQLAMEEAVRNNTPRNDGAEYEKYLWLLQERSS